MPSGSPKKLRSAAARALARAAGLSLQRDSPALGVRRAGAQWLWVRVSGYFTGIVFTTRVGARTTQLFCTSFKITAGKKIERSGSYS